MAQQLQFKSWQRSTLFDLDINLVAGRLKGELPLTINDTATGQTASDKVPFVLMAGADIAAIKPVAIKHMAPAPFCRDAETTKLVHIDLWESSLPWRYTPKINESKLRPWLVLLVGTAKEITIEGGIANVAAAVFLAHDLKNSHLWAHVQFDGSAEISRIVSPRGFSKNEQLGLLAQHEYIAVLVPAFNEEGLDMWTINGEAVQQNFGKKGFLPAFHSWRFSTAEAGDFETLAAALHLPPAGDVGKAALYYRRNIPVDNLHINEKLEIRGAITSMQKEPDQQAAINKVKADIDILNDPLDNTIGLPQYGMPWVPQPNDVPAGWPKDINEDPRYRGASGLGAYMGIKAQEDLVDAAVKQAGALREAGQRINNLATGLLASASLWNHRMPLDKNERLRILGPMMGRMLADGGGMVLNKVTSGASPLVPQIFSGAAQRLLRDRCAHTRYIAGANGGVDKSAALEKVNQSPPLPELVPEGLPHINSIAKEMGLPNLEELFKVDIELLSKIWRKVQQLISEFCVDYRQTRDKLINTGQQNDVPAFRSNTAEALFSKLSDMLQSLLAAEQMPCEGRQILVKIAGEQPGALLDFFSSVLDDELEQLRLNENIWHELVKCMGLNQCNALIANTPLAEKEFFCDDIFGTFQPQPISEFIPINLGLLSDVIFDALDPRQLQPPAKVRLCNRLKGIDCTRLIRPEFGVGLNFPTWDLLKKYDKEWLLPGVNGLEKDSVLALQTNPAFIDAYMLGINTQFMSEMRWRDLAVDRTCTPLRMFWGQVNYATQSREADIEPFTEWAKVTTDLVGSIAHQHIKPADDGNKGGNRLVLVFRTDLFRRYPSTLVYLVKPAIDDNVNDLLLKTPVLEHNDADRDTRKFFGPVFVGNITPEITFFSFDVTPDELEKYWLVLDEPPTELRFRNDQPYDVDHANASSSKFAQTELDQPTRVAISGDELEKLANQ